MFSTFSITDFFQVLSPQDLISPNSFFQLWRIVLLSFRSLRQLQDRSGPGHDLLAYDRGQRQWATSNSQDLFLSFIKSLWPHQCFVRQFSKFMIRVNSRTSIAICSTIEVQIRSAGSWPIATFANIQTYEMRWIKTRLGNDRIVHVPWYNQPTSYSN